MAGPLASLLRTAQQQVRHVDPVRPRYATGLVAEIYAQVERDFGMLAPPVSLHSPAPEVLAAAWALLRETLLVPGQASRADKEAVATAVSAANDCPYCVEIHGAAQDSVGPPARAAGWVSGEGSVPDPAVEYIGVAVTFEYLNRMAHVFLPPSPIPSHGPAVVRRQARRMIGRIAAPARERAAEPAASARFMSDAALPEDLFWARGRAPIADAFARSSAIFDSAGERSVAPAVRELVAGRVARLGEPDGSPGPPSMPSRHWLSDAVAGLPAQQRPAGRLALVTALAPYQADDGIVSAVGESCSEAELIELVAWAAWTAARRVGSKYASAERDGLAEGTP